MTGDGPSFGEIQAVENGRAPADPRVPEDATGLRELHVRDRTGWPGRHPTPRRVDLTVHGWNVNEAPKPNARDDRGRGGRRCRDVQPAAGLVRPGRRRHLPQVGRRGGRRRVRLHLGRARDVPCGRRTQGARTCLSSCRTARTTPSAMCGSTSSPIGTTVPVTNADYVVVRAGQTVRPVSPLAQRRRSTREPLRLARVDEVDGATIAPDYPNKTFSFRADTGGTYYVQYLVAAGVAAGPGPGPRRRDRAGRDRPPPVAVRDVALLPSGGEVLVDVLQNDSDPNGGILVVQSVTVEPGAGSRWPSSTTRRCGSPTRPRWRSRCGCPTASRTGRSRPRRMSSSSRCRHPRSCARRWRTTTRSVVRAGMS